MLPRQQHNGRQGLKAGIRLVYELLKIIYLRRETQLDTMLTLSDRERRQHQAQGES